METSPSSQKSVYCIAIHGGAGTIDRRSMTEEKKATYENALRVALQAGYAVLARGGTSLEAVTEAVVRLEDNPLFNAGKGSVFNHEGDHEMDAAVMDGRTKQAGAVCGVRGIKNPILLAQAVLQHSEHVLLSGRGAEAFAREHDITFEDKAYFYDRLRHVQWEEAIQRDIVTLDHTGDKKFGTVGAVALDQEGNLAAATSTGGMTNKKYGRVGDTPIIGAGTYADNGSCAVSCTGHGEYFMRALAAYDVSCLMRYKSLSLAQACNCVIHEKLAPLGGEGGLIAVDGRGNLYLPFNSSGMYRASINRWGDETIRIYKDR